MWQSPPAELSLVNDEVHVWRAHLDVSAHDLAAYQRSLSADEMSRAQRLHNPADQRRFVARRGILRCLLSNYLGIKPAEILFIHTANGKPTLSIGNERNALSFTLSHASDQALYAVSQGRDIGIDIEYIQCPFDYEQIASSLFAHEEYALLCALPLSQRARAFFRLWTCKEAYIKACGLGLSLALDTFAVSLEPDKPARLLYSHDQVGASRSNLRELWIDENHVAALAVEGNDWQLRYWYYA
jgi:4'-phosphopantetheinyl transferase